jgi:hypothetical protein
MCKNDVRNDVDCHTALVNELPAYRGIWESDLLTFIFGSLSRTNAKPVRPPADTLFLRAAKPRENFVAHWRDYVSTGFWIR